MDTFALPPGATLVDDGAMKLPPGARLAEEPKTSSQFLSEQGAGVARSLHNQAKGMFDLLSTLVDPHMAEKVGNGVIDAQVDQWDHAKDEYSKGNYASAFRRGLAAVTPFIGPLIENSAEKLTSGKPGELSEGVTDLVAPALLMKAAESTPEIASAIGEHVGNAVNTAKAAAAKVPAGAALDAIGIVSPRAAHTINLGRRVARVAGALKDALSPEEAAATAEPAAEPAIAPELDAIARANFKTPYADLPPNLQEFIQQAAAKASGKVQPPAATSPKPQKLPPGAKLVEEPTDYIDQEAFMRAADARRAAQPAAAAQPQAAPAAAAAKPMTMLQMIDADIAAKKAARQALEPPPAAAPPPEEPPEAAAPAATSPQQPAPAAPAAARPPMPAPPPTPEYVTPGQYERRVAAHAADNGISEEEAAQELQGHIQEVDRSSTNRFLHAIGSELGYDHSTLSEIAHATYGTGLGKITHEQMLELGQKLAGEQATREPLAKKGAPLEAAAAPEPEGAPLGGVVAELAPSEIHADPVRFQFKAGTGKGGVTDKFAATSQWNKDNSGILSVWKDPADGKVYVVNGHHRLEMANRLGAPTVTVRYLDAANAAEARMKGALINIAEDQGTAIDAAKVFRDSGMTPEDLQKQGIKLDGRISKPGLAMANLDPQIFNQVVAGDITPERGAMIGNVAEHADQRQLVELIDARERAGKAMSDSQITEMLRMQAPKVTETQTSLFGDNEVERSLIAEKAAVSDYIQSRLAQKRRLFNAVGSERAATRLAEAGNVIDAEGNAAVALATSQEHLIYQKLSTSTGAVDEALNEAAKALHAGENPAIVKVKTYAKIEPVIRAEADKLTGRSKTSGERPGGSAPAGSGEAGAGQHDREAAAAAPAKTTIGEMMENPIDELGKARKRRGAKTRKTVADLMPN